MMLVSGVADSSKIVYVDTVRETLCSGTMYRFSAYFLNTNLEGYCVAANFPSFTLRVETTAGQLIAFAIVPPLPFPIPEPSTVPKFHLFKVDFAMPAGVNGLVLKIEDNATVYAPCGYLYAIDDIQFAALGPETQIAFDGAVGLELVRSVCFQNNEMVSMTGVNSGYYSNTVLQWEQSTDNGITWTDILGATAANYSPVFSTPDTFLFRLGQGDASNIANPYCRVVSNILKVEVDGIPANADATSNSPVCAGSPIIFNAAGGASYEWKGPNGFYDNVYYAQIYSSTLADSGMYYADIISRGGCRATDSVYVKMIGTNVYVSPDTSICKGRSVRLTASPGATYSWSPPDGLSSTSVISPQAKPDVTTTYVVKVAANDGCTDTAHVQIKVLNTVAVKAMIQGTDYLCRSFDSASFKNLSTGKITKWNWNFDNGQTTSVANPAVQHYSIPDNRDSYVISLAIMDSTGCADTAYHRIKVANNCFIAVPSGFTPNGDGLNDFLYPVNAYKAKNLLFMVFNRNGQLVFETTDWTRKWDGTVNGKPQASGVYVWLLTYDDPSGKHVSLKGTTALIR
jgi:gliding motility-associated-like protein